MENIREQMEKLEISSEAINEVLFVAKRMDDKGLVNSFAGNISTKRTVRFILHLQDRIKDFLHRKKLQLLMKMVKESGV